MATPSAPSGWGGFGVGAIAALALPSFAWTASVTFYVAFHYDLMGAILARQAEMKTAYEDRLAEARARLDEAASLALLRSSTKRWRQRTAWDIARSKRNCIGREAKPC